jgi:hypothetical protein
MSDPNKPLQRDELVDKPGIVGARWWQDGLAQTDPIARRTAMKALFGAAVGVAAVGGLVALLARSSKGSGGSGLGSSGSYGSSDDYDTSQSRTALAMQREYGWNFGAAGEALVWDGVSTAPFSRAALASLTVDLSPSDSAHRPFFVSTLLDSVTAQRKTVPQGDPSTFVPVQDVLQPIFTEAMGVAFRSGRALASLFDPARFPGAPKMAIVVDLPGPESIAFAAGAASLFDPIMLMDNWPHPRGVVRTHLTLAAAAYFQPLFAKAKSTRPRHSLPMFLLDRARLASYTDDASQFDNRFVARMPSAKRLLDQKLERLLYVAPGSFDTIESDDLNEDFVDAKANGIQVRMLGADSFGPDRAAAGNSASPPTGADAGVSPPHGSGPDAGSPIPTPDTPQHFYGRRAATHAYFWSDYWAQTSQAKAEEPDFPRPGTNYTPEPRRTQFSSGTTLAPSHPTPSGFGTVPVVVAVATGVVVGAGISRSGSWTRASGWGGS